MDFDVLPGPSLPELARTALARAAAATVSDADPGIPGTPAGRPVAPGQVPVRANPLAAYDYAELFKGLAPGT